MRRDTTTAIKLLRERKAAFVLCKGDTIVSSNEDGITPLLALIEDGNNYEGFCAAGMIVGKAIAFLYVKLGIKEVYASIMSEEGIYTLARYGIYPICERSISDILRHDDADVQQVEKLVSDIQDVEAAVTALAMQCALL